jgi:hypothetical protein
MADFSLDRNRTQNSQKHEIPVMGPGDINLLVIYAGTLVLDWFRDRAEASHPDTRSLEIVLEANSLSLYSPPLSGLPPAPNLPALNAARLAIDKLLSSHFLRLSGAISRLVLSRYSGGACSG